MDDATQAERERCIRIVDVTMEEAPPEAMASLVRVRNMIANGVEPESMAEQGQHQTP